MSGERKFHATILTNHKFCEVLGLMSGIKQYWPKNSDCKLCNCCHSSKSDQASKVLPYSFVKYWPNKPSHELCNCRRCQGKYLCLNCRSCHGLPAIHHLASQRTLMLAPLLCPFSRWLLCLLPPLWYRRLVAALVTVVESNASTMVLFHFLFSPLAMVPLVECKASTLVLFHFLFLLWQCQG